MTTVELVAIVVSVGVVVILTAVAYRYILRQQKGNSDQCVSQAPLEEVNVHPHLSGSAIVEKDSQVISAAAAVDACCQNSAKAATDDSDLAGKEQTLPPLTLPAHSRTARTSREYLPTTTRSETFIVTEASPSTARLEDYMEDSVSLFSFLKGHRSNTSQLSNSVPGTPVPPSPVKMPVLTRTQARSGKPPPLSIKNNQDSGSTAKSRPTAIGSGRWLSSSKNTNKQNLRLLALQANNTTIMVTDSNSMGVSAPASPTAIVDTSVNQSCTSSHSTLSLPQHHKVRESSSIMALYGSPNPSPNGSVVDVSSVQAVYCRSLRSIAASTTTYTQDDALSVNANHE
ncbi:hypothetical protein BGW42_002284 [Actinomortierella wolfii]|nr:hypothetical protein BGW42_002284 [Actinomortierella wolfii]